MLKKDFTKPWLSHDDQIQLLLQRGLKIPNKKKTRHLLEHICYYRMSAYWYLQKKSAIDQNILEQKTTKYYFFLETLS